MEEGGRRETVAVMECEKDLTGHAGFQEGKGPQAKKCGQPLDAGMDSCREPPERNALQLVYPVTFPIDLLCKRT